MTILQISRVQMRRGLQEDLPESLASGEIGWSIDQRRLFIGNGTYDEGAPELGNTEILTTHSDVLGLDNLYSYKGLLGGYQVQTGDTPSLDVTRSMQDKLDDFVNIHDFGTLAMGNGVFNCAHVFNHALEQLYKASKLGTVPAVRRTLHVSAGVYLLSGDYIRLLPFVKLKGDGKNSTFIVQVDATQPCTVSSASVRSEIAPSPMPIPRPAVIYSIGNNVDPGNIEVEGITFINMTGKDVVVLDATTDVLFNRVRMQGDPNVNLPAPTLPGTESASLRIQYSAGYSTAPSNLTFTNCDFADKTYGIYTRNHTANVNVIGSTFADLYQGVALGLLSIDYPTPKNIKISHSVFSNIAAEGIIGGGPNGLAVNHIVSAFNTFINVGFMQTNLLPIKSAIDFNGNNCYSFGDTFDRPAASTVPAVNLNGMASFATLPDGRVMMGKQLSVGGSDVVLEDGILTPTSANIVVGFDDYPTIVEYTLLRNTDKRVGTLHISTIPGAVPVITYSDDYVETGDVGVSLVPALNSNTVELLYTSTLERFHAILKLSSRTLVGNHSAEAILLARMPDTVPGAPTGVVAS